MGRENWESVYGFSAFYEVSSLGRVRSRKTGKILTPTEDDDGYLRVHLVGYKKNKRLGCQEQVRKSPFVHRLVATAFIGARPGSGYEVGHRDGDRQNNKSSNLDWVTKTQNAAQRAKHGNNGEGSKNSCAKLSEEQVLEIRRLHEDGHSGASLSEMFGVSNATIHNIVTRKKWRHI